MIRRFDREILALALPALGTLAADPLVSLIDTAFVGRLGAAPLAALALDTSIFSLSFFLFIFLAYGTTPLVGGAVGRGDPDAAGRTVTQAVTLALLVGVLVTALLLLFGRPLLLLMGGEADTLGPALLYLRIRALAAPAVLLITAGNGAFRGFQDTRTPLGLSLIVSAANLVLDPLLIFGLGWGLAGAAVATAAAQWLGAALFVWVLFGARRRRYRIPLRPPRPRELLPLLRIGGALSLRTLALLLAMTLATAVAARVGVVELAAHQVAAQLWTFLALVLDALAVAGQVLVARLLGAGRGDEARLVGNRLLLMGFGVGVGLALSFWLLRGWLPGLFSTDPAVAAAVMRIYAFVALMQPLSALVFVWDGIFMGAEAFGFLARAMILSALASALVLLLVLPFDWGLSGVWWGIVTLVGARLLTQAWRYRDSERWRGRAQRSGTA